MWGKLETLAKCLALTSSPNDGEALAAARSANKIIAEMGLSWSDLCEGAGIYPDHRIAVTIQVDDIIDQSMRDKVLAIRLLLASPYVKAEEYAELRSIANRWILTGQFSPTACDFMRDLLYRSKRRDLCDKLGV